MFFVTMNTSYKEVSRIAIEYFVTSIRFCQPKINKLQNIQNKGKTWNIVNNVIVLLI